MKTTNEKPNNTELHLPKQQVEDKNTSPEFNKEQMQATAERSVAAFEADVDRTIDSLESRAHTAGLEIDSADTEKLQSLKQEAGAAKETLLQKLFGRVRTALKIPASIEQEVAQTDFSAVDTFNDDPDIAPPIIRKPGKLSKALLAATTLATIGATHEPQIERGVHAGIERAIDLETRTELAFKSLLNDTKNFIARNKPFGREAYADELPREHSDDAENPEVGGTHFEGTMTANQKQHLDKFVEANPNLSPDKQEQALELIRSADSGFERYDNFFLGMEYIHGQISKEQMEEAKKTLYRIEHDARVSLTAEERKSPIRVAHKLIEQRKTYAREKADIYSMITSGEGNCEAEVRFLLATVPDVTHGSIRTDMAVQVYTDHVRFLVRPKNETFDVKQDKPWQAIDGHSVVDVTPEELKGTLIVDPKEMMTQSLRLQETHPKSDGDDTVPEKAFGYTTNSMLKWETPDGRIPHRAASNGDILFRVDETRDATIKFADAKKPKIEEHTQFIEVSPELFPGAVEVDTSKLAEVQEAEVKKIRVAPSGSDIERMLRSGIVMGHFNDLTPLSGVDVQTINIRLEGQNNANFATDIDLSPLDSSELTQIIISPEMTMSGFGNLNVKHVEKIYTGMSGLSLIEKAVKESRDINEINLSILSSDNTAEEQIRLMRNAPNSPEINRITKTLREKRLNEQGSGNLIVTVDSPFEAIDVMWKYDAIANTWTSVGSSIKEGDFLSPQLRSVFDHLKVDPTVLDVPSFTTLAFLSAEKIAFDKIKTVSIEAPSTMYVESPDGREQYDRLVYDVSALAQAKNLETITLKLDASTETLDVSALASIPFKHLVIETDSKLLEHVKGIPGKTIKIEYTGHE